jgi:1D-myo-inositol 3-kinase
MDTPPDFLVIGHVAQDLQPDGTFRLGGTVTYAALLAARLGLRAGIVTSGTPREAAALEAAIPGVAVACKPAATPTIFENRYEGDRRTQYLRARAEPLTDADVPEDWRAAPITLLGPIADEVDASVAACLSSSPLLGSVSPFPQEKAGGWRVRGATPQGWLRRWDPAGCVHPTSWSNAAEILPHLGVLVCSVEDVAVAAGNDPARDVVATWAARVPYVVVTDGPRGARLWHDGREAARVPAFVVAEADPTGAGDAFAAAFLIALWRGRGPLEAMRYAHAAASYVVAAPGASGMPTEAQIAVRLEAQE